MGKQFFFIKLILVYLVGGLGVGNFTFCYGKSPSIKNANAQYSYTSDAGFLCDRGENCLLLGKFQEALDHFKDAAEFAVHSNDSAITVPIVFRSLFGQLFSYANLNNEEMTEEVGAEIIRALSSLDCCNCSEEEWLFVKSPDVPILGAEHISVEECIERVDSTANSALDLLKGNVKLSIKQTCEGVIHVLRSQGRRCCREGWAWKLCLQPLINKWHDWFKNGLPNSQDEITMD